MAEPIRLLVVDDVRDHAQLVAEFIARKAREWLLFEPDFASIGRFELRDAHGQS